VLSTPEGRAWAILGTAFSIFCTLVISVPLSIRWYVIHASRAQDTILEDPIDGAVYVKDPRGANFMRVTQRGEQIAEGATVATDEHLRAFLRLFEGSTLTLYNDTQVVLDRARAPRYDNSTDANEIWIQVDRGRVAIGVASPLDRTLIMGVKTPHATLLLKEGNFSVVVDDQETQLTIRPIRPGEATVLANGETRRFTSGRCRITADDPIEGPLPPEQDLIVNGDFSAVLDRGWEQVEQQRQKQDDPYGEAEIVALEGKRELAFRRLGAETHGETSITQRIDKDVRDFQSLKLSCEVLVNYQSLAGGGYQSTEFPIMIELKYRDPLGNPRSQYWGFYYKEPGTGPEWRTMVNGLKVIQGEWYFFETDNLVQTLGDVKPVYIEALRVYASGWDWNSAITNVSLLVQE
jgi:hypothetical protein